MSSKLVRERALDFKPKTTDRSPNEIQLYTLLLDKSLNPLGGCQVQGICMQAHILPFDVYGYWHDRKSERYFVLLTKTVYSLPVGKAYLTESKLSDADYIGKTLPDYKVQQKAPFKYHIQCGSFAPDFDYELEFFRPPFKGAAANKAVLHAISLNPELGEPFMSVVQHNYNFSRVMLHKTNKMSVSVTSYYRQSEGHTIAVNYTLNFIHELPPKFLGGHGLLLKEVEQGICSLIDRTRELALIQ